MERKRLYDAMDCVLDEVKKYGAEGDVIATHHNSLNLRASQGEIDEYKASSGQLVGLRLIKDQKVAIGYCESLEKQNLITMVANTLESSKYSKIDEQQKICAPNHSLKTQSAEILQDSNADVSEKIKLLLDLESSLLNKPLTVASPYNGYSENENTQLIANTNGLRCEHKERAFACYAYALLDDKKSQSIGGAVSVARRFEALQSDFCAEHSYLQAFDLLKGKPIPTGKYSVLFEINCLTAVFSAFGSCFSAMSAMKGINPWRHKVGQQVSHPLLTISDKILMPNGFKICAFDDEGFVKTDTGLIKEGRLEAFLQNSRSANYFSVKNSANAGRTAKNSLDVASAHTVIELGKSSDAEVFAGDYFEVVKLQGIHSGADPVSGDFSFGASGFLCRDGKRLTPVRGVTVSGNFYLMLNEVEALGKNLHMNDSHCFYSPDIRFSRLQISGR